MMKVRLAGQESESEDEEESVCTWNIGCEAAMREDEDGLWAIDSEAPTPDAAAGKWQAEVGDDWVDVDGITLAAAAASGSGLGGAVGMADGEGGSAALISAGVAATGAALGAAFGLSHVLTAALVALLVLIYYFGFAGKGRAAAAAAAAAAPTTTEGGKAPPAVLVFGPSEDVLIDATASAAACAGTYTLMPGMKVHERPVWQHEAGKDLYVYFFNPDLAQTESEEDDDDDE
jgi:hypothetical protein